MKKLKGIAIVCFLGMLAGCARKQSQYLAELTDRMQPKVCENNTSNEVTASAQCLDNKKQVSQISRKLVRHYNVIALTINNPTDYIYTIAQNGIDLALIPTKKVISMTKNFVLGHALGAAFLLPLSCLYGGIFAFMLAPLAVTPPAVLLAPAVASFVPPIALGSEALASKNYNNEVQDLLPQLLFDNSQSLEIPSKTSITCLLVAKKELKQQFTLRLLSDKADEKLLIDVRKTTSLFIS